LYQATILQKKEYMNIYGHILYVSIHTYTFLHKKFFIGRYVKKLQV